MKLSEIDSKFVKVELGGEEEDRNLLAKIQSNFDDYKIESYAKFESLKAKIAKNQKINLVLTLILFILCLACIGCLVYALFFNKN